MMMLDRARQGKARQAEALVIEATEVTLVADNWCRTSGSSCNTAHFLALLGRYFNREGWKHSQSLRTDKSVRRT